MVITSKANRLIKTISSLSDKKYRRQTGLYVVEGIKPVNECIKAGCQIENIICSESFIKKFGIAFLNCVTVSDDIFKYLSEEKTPQGVLATVKIPKNELIAPQNPCLLLEGIQDPGNMGTILRTANAGGYSEIYLIDCVDPFSQKSVRASMSGIFFVTLRFGSREEVLSVLSGTPIICADIGGENIFSFNPPQKFCLCIGNEGNGLSGEIINKAYYTVKIPMNETCESLNAGVSAGIAMYLLKRSNFN